MKQKMMALVLLLGLSFVATLILYWPYFVERQAQKKVTEECRKEWEKAQTTPIVNPDDGQIRHRMPNCDPQPTPKQLPLLEGIHYLYPLCVGGILFFLGLIIGIGSYIRNRKASNGAYFFYLAAAAFGILTQLLIVYTHPGFALIAPACIVMIGSCLVFAWMFGAIGRRTRSLRLMLYISILYLTILIIFGFHEVWEAFSMFYLFVCFGGSLIDWRQRSSR